MLFPTHPLKTKPLLHTLQRAVEQAETVQEDSREGSQSSDTGLQPQSCSGQVCKDKAVPPTSATTTAAAGNGHDREKQEPVNIANSFMAGTFLLSIPAHHFSIFDGRFVIV